MKHHKLAFSKMIEKHLHSMVLIPKVFFNQSVEVFVLRLWKQNKQLAFGLNIASDSLITVNNQRHEIYYIFT